MPKKPARSQLEIIGSHFEEFQKNGQGYKALCPAHPDNNPSLSIKEGKSGRIVLHCHAGCETKAVVEAAGLTMADLMPAKSGMNIVATYDYCDATGTPIYQVVRLEPKSFRLRKPNGEGGWIWQNVFDGVTQVPYRLFELLAAPHDEIVFLSESEKDVENLQAVGCVATCAFGGAGNFPAHLGIYFTGRHVVILAHNDDAGRAHAKDVAQKVGPFVASVKIVELPGLPEKGDVSDWLEAGGSIKQLAKIVEKTPLYVPASVETEKCRTGEGVLPFPSEVFPEKLRKFITSVSESLPCPPDFPGAMLLPVLAACIGRKFGIKVTDGWIEFPVLWVVTVARSGERKTPAFEKATEPLRRKQREFFETFAKEKENYDARKPDEKLKTASPQLHQVLTTDSTIEALRSVLAANPNGVLFPSDELSGWVRGISQYKQGRGNDRQHWLSIWSGTQIVINRVGREPIFIDNPFVCVVGGIQPDALGDLVDDVREDGFAARILYSFPDAIPAGDWKEATRDRCQDYTKVCNGLGNLKLSPSILGFSKLAKSRWAEWVSAHRKESPPDNLRPIWSKAEGHCARLALVLFLSRKVCGEAKGNLIDANSVSGAIKLVEYFKSHAHRVYGRIADQNDSGRIGKALQFIKKHGGVVTARMVRQYALAESTEDAQELFKDLQDLGHGTYSIDPKKSVVFRLGKADD